MKLRKLWCRKVVEEIECSFFTKGARWSFGCEGDFEKQARGVKDKLLLDDYIAYCKNQVYFAAKYMLGITNISSIIRQLSAIFRSTAQHIRGVCLY